MILTGKSNWDFKLWFYDDIMNRVCTFEELFYNKNESVLFTHIIEWFDSVGIYINVTPMYVDHKEKYALGLFYSAVCFKDGTPTSVVDYNKNTPRLDRSEATHYAIIKANQIYNERTN